MRINNRTKMFGHLVGIKFRREKGILRDTGRKEKLRYCAYEFLSRMVVYGSTLAHWIGVYFQ
jgi:hypothetical protein